jgi:hypothetical protein
MVTGLMGGAALLTAVGALLFWGARWLGMERFYGDSCIILALALVLAGLGQI